MLHGDGVLIQLRTFDPLWLLNTWEIYASCDLSFYIRFFVIEL